MTSRVSHYLVLAGTLFLSGCDFTAGVYRVYRLNEVPLPVCVEENLRQVAGVTNVKYARNQEVNRRDLHRFSYQAEGVDVRLDIEQKSTRPEYYHSYMLFNTVPSQELIARLRPVMARIDQALETNCYLKGLSHGVQEYCPRGLFRDNKCKP